MLAPAASLQQGAPVVLPHPQDCVQLDRVPEAAGSGLPAPRPTLPKLLQWPPRRPWWDPNRDTCIDSGSPVRARHGAVKHHVQFVRPHRLCSLVLRAKQNSRAFLPPSPSCPRSPQSRRSRALAVPNTTPESEHFKSFLFCFMALPALELHATSGQGFATPEGFTALEAGSSTLVLLCK